MNHQFTSQVKDNSLSDKIRQSYFDLWNYDKDKLNAIFIEYLKYLEQDISIEEAECILFFTYTVMKSDPEHFFTLYNEIIENSTFKVYKIIITSYILRDMKIKDSIHFQNYQKFIKNCMSDILHHLNANNKDLIVLNQKIPEVFKFEFISNIAILSEINEEIVSCIGKCFYNIKSCDAFIDFIQKVIDADLFHILTIPIISNKCMYSNLNIDFCKKCIENLSNSLFIDYFEQIQDLFISAKELNASFIIFLLQRCNQLHMKLNSIERIFYFISVNDITPQILEYLKEYDFLLPEELVPNFIDLPDQEFLIKIIPKFELIPKHLQSVTLNETIDVNFYDKIFKTGKIESPVFSTNKFYIHIYKNNYECSKKTIKSISKIFQDSFENDKFNHTIDDIIFSSYPPNNQQIEFLITFFNNFDNQHMDLYYNFDHMKYLINEIFDKNIIPLYSFFKIINYDYKFALLKKGAFAYQKKSHLLYYMFKFSKRDKKYGKDQIYLKVYNTPTIENPDFINFIIHNDKNILTKLDEKSLLLAVSALIYGEYQNIGKIDGLTKETIIPFYAIVFNNWTKRKIPLMKIFPTKETLDLFMMTFKSMLNNESPLIKASVDSILNNDGKNTSLFNLARLKEPIMEILIESLLKNEYCADKTTLLSYLISNSHLFRNVKFNVTHFFNYLIKHLHEMNYQSIEYKINFNFFKNIKEILSLFIQVIQDANSSESDVINSLYLLTNLCTNVPKINIENTFNLQKILINEDIDNKYIIFNDLDKIFNLPNEFNQLIDEFIKNKKDLVDKTIKNDNIFEREAQNKLHPILTSNDLEKIDDQLIILFKQMMNNKSMAKGYFQILFQQIDYKNVNPYQLKDIFQNEFNEYEDVFNQSKNLISERINSNGSDFEIALLSNLFKSIEVNISKYQAFLCLKSIACTFPFLFETRTNQLFETVLPELNNFFLLFEKRNEEENEMKIKIALSAFSFLISALNSTIIMDEFVVWLLNDFERFSDSAIYCFNFIIYSVLKESKLNNLMVSALMKYDFNQKIITIMKRDIKESIWKINYFYMIYLLLNEFYNSPITYIRKFRNIFTDEFKKHATIIPFIIEQITEKEFIDLPKTNANNNILIFMKKINKIKHFWINYKRKSQTLQNFYLESNISNDENRKIYNTDYLNNQDHLLQILLCNAVKSNDNLVFSQLCILIEKISHNPNCLKIFLNLIENDLEIIEKNNNLEKTLTILLKLANLNEFQSSLYNSLIQKLTNICLRFFYAMDDAILIKISDLLIILEKIPINTIHIIGFLFHNSLNLPNEFLPRAFQLCSKFKANQLSCLNSAIELSFYNSIYEDVNTLEMINNYLKIIQSIPQFHYNDYIELLKAIFEIYDPTEKNDKTLINVIIKLTNLLTPKRNSKENIIINDSFDDNQVQYQSIPQCIIDLNPNFWEFFVLNRNKIENIIQRSRNINKSMNIFSEYPEFFSFSLRYKSFQNKISQTTNTNQKIELHIDPKNILESSISQLDDIELVEWKNAIFKIKYIENIGQDEGGLTKDWLTKLVRELLNSQNGLFQISEQMSYHPNFLSFANPDHLKYFKFAGKIIAKALILGATVDGHFSRSFLLQILHRKVKLNDFKDTDESLFNSLEQINKIDDEKYFENMDLYFERDDEEYGIYKTVELKENGSQIQLTNENKNEYINLTIDYLSRKRIIEQINAFCDGFYSLIPYEFIKTFTSNELDRMICGLPIIDIDDMKKHICIAPPYTKDSPIVKFFFDSISRWDQNNLSKLLMFVTGSPKVPAIGFKGYNDKGYPIKIQPTDSPETYPVAHTCFNTLDLPKCETEKELNDKLLISIQVEQFDII